eukprot:240863-Chlamydomonas_euryale.AAC.1
MDASESGWGLQQAVQHLHAQQHNFTQQQRQQQQQLYAQEQQQQLYLQQQQQQQQLYLQQQQQQLQMQQVYMQEQRPGVQYHVLGRYGSPLTAELLAEASAALSAGAGTSAGLHVLDAGGAGAGAAPWQPRQWQQPALDVHAAALGARVFRVDSPPPPISLLRHPLPSAGAAERASTAEMFAATRAALALHA